MTLRHVLWDEIGFSNVPVFLGLTKSPRDGPRYLFRNLNSSDESKSCKVKAKTENYAGVIPFKINKIEMIGTCFPAFAYATTISYTIRENKLCIQVVPE